MTVNQSFLLHRSTYDKKHTLLETLSGAAAFLGRPYVDVFEGGVMHISASSTGGGTPDQRRLYQDGSLLLVGSVSGEYLAGMYGETTTPPGYGIYSVSANAEIWRWNIDNVPERVASPTQMSRFTWSNQEQALFGLRYNGSYTRLCKLSSLNFAAETSTADTAFGPAYSTDILANGGIVDGRVYICSDNAINTGRMGWVDALNGTYTELVDYAQDTGTGIVCASTYNGSGAVIAIQCGDTGAGNRIDLWDTAGSRAAQVTLASESATGYDTLGNWVHDRVNNYLWVKRAGSALLYVIDLSNGTVRDTWEAADLPDSGTGLQLLGPVGSPSGGVYAVGGATINKLYRLG